jgi:hypothetical protein
LLDFQYFFYCHIEKETKIKKNKENRMAAKQYRLTQRVNLNGAMTTVSAFITCEATELDAFLGLLEGEVTVFEELKKVGVADTLVNSYNRISKISLPAEGGRFAMIKPKGSLIVKNSVGVDDVTSACKLFHPFPDAPAVKPTSVIVQMTGGESLAN